MKIRILLVVVVMLWGEVLVSHGADHVDGGYFLKRIEYNILMKGGTEADNLYNLRSKSAIDRAFFGETNSPVEFVIRTSFDGTSGFRIIKGSSDSVYRMEVMNMPNSDKVVNILSKKENEILIPYELQSLMSLDALNQINEYNKKVIYAKQSGEIYKPYRKKPKSFTISELFAEKLYRKMVSLIDGFKAEGIPPLISDGYEVTFRCVVADELWTLVIHIPQGKALQLSDLCRQIIADGNNNKLDESVYLNLLDEI